ncbi:MAG TPA: CdaR family protein, partial [Candidatus Eremiobacteraceae bacterium]|nr:CdaR family protein [Candidatus Eremiobacteraceae bacterium]
FGLKVTAVVVSVALWFTLNYFGSSQEVFSKTLELPLSVHGLAPGFVATPQIQTVSVDLSGPRADVDSVTPSDLAAYVDGTGHTGGVYSLTVNVVGRDADKVKVIAPDQAVVSIDRYAFRSVPVLARGAGGTLLANAELAPSTIEVAGGASAVAKVVAVQVMVPEPGSLPAGFSAVMKPDPIDGSLQVVHGVSVLGVVRVNGPTESGAPDLRATPR